MAAELAFARPSIGDARPEAGRNCENNKGRYSLLQVPFGRVSQTGVILVAIGTRFVGPSADAHPVGIVGADTPTDETNKHHDQEGCLYSALDEEAAR
jgi:hypothetical protein